MNLTASPDAASAADTLARWAQEPIEFRSDMEHVEEDEAEVAIAIGRTMRGIAETVLQDEGQAERGVHAKSHGIVLGELRVHDGLPPSLAQGLFAKPATYPVVMRLSTIPGDLLDDRVSVPRGVALKVVGVEGERLFVEFLDAAARQRLDIVEIEICDPGGLARNLPDRARETPAE